jgi:hypothetical protein
MTAYKMAKERLPIVKQRKKYAKKVIMKYFQLVHAFLSFCSCYTFNLNVGIQSQG